MHSPRRDTRLVYPDANTVPWPLNHHAYVRICAARLRKEVSHEPQILLPQCHVQRGDIRRALLRLQATEETPGLVLAWNEVHGWSRQDETGRQALVLGAEPLLPPDAFARAVTALLAPENQRMMMVQDRSRGSAHPADPRFERRLAAYREL
ncbi:DUF6292 family protein [Nocardiopsis algeriensis]|uniref:Uncharacterized protein n=1 Tax=Nocardiopsis algeriensis TaxID=1478215 RepID=A0A841IMT5_9ACTN|nr:DUF6292 family protein [Nocardiopsis algeriensis]MBB6119963.1 hypothetical protein [Nocardiopsis algeriensis]